MRVKLAVCLCFVILLTGCDRTAKSLNHALLLRNKLLESDGCKFNAAVTADYGDEMYHFSMDCQVDKEGNLSFAVTEPMSISGIKGRVSESGGSLTFDDRVLAFQTIADGQITPVAAPWLFIRTLRSGYINASTEMDDGYTVVMDDSYREDALKLQFRINRDNLPEFGEIFWKGCRILTVSVKDFTIL